MIGEGDAHHVPNFSFVPIGSGPEIYRAGDGFVFGDFCFEAEVAFVVEGSKFIDDLEARVLSEVIEGGNIEKHFVAELFFAVGEGFGQGFQVEGNGLFATEFGSCQETVSEDFAESGDVFGGDGVVGGHGLVVLGVFLEEDFLLILSGVLFFNFFLEFHEAFDEGFGARRAAGNVNVHRDEFVYSLKDGVGAIHAAGGGAGTHGDAPFWLRHLIPDAFYGECHFISDGSRDDHDIGLAGGEAHDLHAEAGDVET